MTDQLYNMMNWADVEEVTYAESVEPKHILGPHLTDRGLLIQAFVPTAKAITVSVSGDSEYPMELADEAGFYAVQSLWLPTLEDESHADTESNRRRAFFNRGRYNAVCHRR